MRNLLGALISRVVLGTAVVNVVLGTAVVNIALYFLSGSLSFAAKRSGANKVAQLPRWMDRQIAGLFPSRVAAGRGINQSIVMDSGLDKIFVITNPPQLTAR
jgi:hypothetical protein